MNVNEREKVCEWGTWSKCRISRHVCIQQRWPGCQAGAPRRLFQVQRDALGNAGGRGKEGLKIWRDQGRAVMTARFYTN